MEGMINPRNLVKELKLREDDSKRIDAILKVLQNPVNIEHKPVLVFDHGYQMAYDHEFKVFQAGSHEINTETFKSGRECIDYCLYNWEYEKLESTNEPEHRSETSELNEVHSDVVNLDVPEVDVENVQEDKSDISHSDKEKENN